MTPHDVIESALNQSYGWSRALAEDLSDAPLAFPTPNGGNHATWVVGHLALARAGLLSFITGEPNALGNWAPIFGGTSTPVDHADTYPAYGELLKTWEHEHKRSMKLLKQTTPDGLDATPPAVPEAFASVPGMDTVGGVFLFIAMHEMSHRGQLADCRRALGRKPLVF